MNLRKQVEPLKKAALQASSLQRHAHHAASRLTWVERWLKRAYHHHAQSRELKRYWILVQRTRGSQGADGQELHRGVQVRREFAVPRTCEPRSTPSAVYR